MIPYPEHMIPTSNSPLISCLCVTKRTLKDIQSSIRCFLSQTYSNKELIILHHTGDEEIKRFVNDHNSQYNNASIIYMKNERGLSLTLGELRNLAIESCNGEYFCQWDDDDWYHMDRLTIQFRALVNNYQQCTLLTNLLIFDQTTQTAYLTPFRFWENSILCNRSLFTHELRYPALTQGEDSSFVNQLTELHGSYPLVAPYLYIYIIHESNTWPQAHYTGILSRSKKMPDNISVIINDIVKGRISNREASEILGSPQLLSAIKYFSNVKNNFLLSYIQQFVSTG